MKALLIGVFLLGILTGAKTASVDFDIKDVARHECSADKKGQVVFLQSIRVDDPLSENTCGDLHSVDKIGL